MRSPHPLLLRQGLVVLIALASAGAFTDSPAVAAKMTATATPGQLKAACGRAGGSYGSNGVAYWCDGDNNSVTCTKKPNACFATSNALREAPPPSLGPSTGGAANSAAPHRNLGAAAAGQSPRLGPSL